MNRRLAAIAAVVPLFALSLLANAGPASDSAVSTVGKMLTDAGPTPTTNAEADVRAFQERLTKKFVGQEVSVDGGTIIQIVTEGGGVKLISFPPDETAGTVAVRRSLSHATLRPDQEAAGKKLAPGDQVSVTGTVASVSVHFDDAKDGDKPICRVNLTLKDSSIAAFKVVPRGKKKPTTAQ